MSLTAESLLAQSPTGVDGQWLLILAISAGVVLLVILVVLAQYFRLWLRAYMNNAGVSMLDLIGMRLRQVDANMIVLAKIQLVNADIHDVSTTDLERHCLAGGRVPNVTRAMIAANQANIELDWRTACANDLSGHDIIEAINARTDASGIDCSDSEQETVTVD